MGVLMFKESRIFRYLLTCIILVITPVTFAAQGRILDRLEAEQANTAAFAAEAEIFKSIGLSIALSIAQCQFQEDCEPAVDKSELETLLNTLDERINKLVSKQETGEEDYTEILTAYVNQRENYLEYQKKLEALSVPEDVVAEPVEQEPFAEEPAETTDVTQQQEIDFSIFEDVDEELGVEPDTEAVDEFADEPLPEE
jgi:hypothetical protein